MSALGHKPLLAIVRFQRWNAMSEGVMPLLHFALDEVPRRF